MATQHGPIEPRGELAFLLSSSGSAEAVRVLRSYFAPRPRGRFSGSRFEGLGGGGDRPAVADEFVAEDLVAVALLSVNIKGDAALEILERRRARLHQLLRRVPTDVALADLTVDDVGDDWPLRALYRELRSIDTIGKTAATKLLARKRPHMAPILDTVITAELRIVKGQYWGPLHAWLTTDGKAHHRHLLDLRDAADLGTEISALRVFDVLAWMSGKGYTRSGGPAVP
ncbi:hypothetical protein CTKZ_32620 [Cellulomonas algicola]|uniref:Uncharacterized protein n=1 Tax=Cellulomonas algicola TaxID=2071633 RepID=A0A401V441_9CELL|nr:DUF6308 family protein [Cellulomonas algicola]GCD21700.1 hypothetical protein CTKZ_32620 [Cellulomonas algicola]